MKIYLAVFIFVLQIALGGMAIEFISILTGGGWGAALRPLTGSIKRAFWILPILFLPIILFMSSIYPWVANPQLSDVNPLRTEFFLNRSFFVMRAFIYFFIWIVVSCGLDPSPSGIQSSRKIKSALSLMALLFSVSFAAFDWIMTIDPEWVSTGFGALFLVTCLSSGFSFFIFLLLSKPSSARDSERETPLRKGDYGNLLLMCATLWAYLDYMQYLVVWSGNLPKELEWFHKRTLGTGALLIVLTLALHFAVPFLVLLFKSFKTNDRILKVLCLLLLLGQLLENLLWVNP